jgi:hypothetical protein
MEKVVFSQLSWPLKISVIISYLVSGLWLLFFVSGFIVGIAISVV